MADVGKNQDNHDETKPVAEKGETVVSQQVTKMRENDAPTASFRSGVADEPNKMMALGWDQPPKNVNVAEIPAPVFPAATTRSADGRTADRAADQVRIDEMLKDPNNAALDKQVAAMRDHLSHLPASVRKEAQQSLDQLLVRGTKGYEASHSDSTSYAPALTEKKITDTLDNLNRAMSTGGDRLSSAMGDNPKEREANRDLAVAQALRNYGDSRGVQQGYHQTCLLDGKIGDQARRSPDVSSGILAAAMTSQDGTVKIGDKTVKLDASFMRADAAAWNSTGGERAHNMSADVRMLTGIYANALQKDGRTFVMGDRPGAQGDSGDRLLDSKGRTLSIHGKPVDSPVVTVADSARLNAMTGNDGIIATNVRQWGGGEGSQLKNVTDAKDLAALIASNGSVQVGLNAHVLFRDGRVGADGGGHLTSVTQCRTGPDGQMQFFVQDTNRGTSGWYSGARVMAAINNEKFDHAAQPGESAEVLVHPSRRSAVGADGVTTDRSPVLHPRGMVTQEQQDTIHKKAAEEQEKKDKDKDNLPQKTREEEERREHQRLEEKQKAMEKETRLYQKYLKEKDDEEERERIRRQRLDQNENR